jgi:hypothetical protein
MPKLEFFVSNVQKSGNAATYRHAIRTSVFLNLNFFFSGEMGCME